MKNRLAFIIAIIVFHGNYAYTEDRSPFVVYPQKVILPKKGGDFGLDPIEVDNLYFSFKYFDSSGYSIISWPPKDEPESFLDLIILNASYEYLNGDYFTALNIIDNAIDAKLYGTVSDAVAYQKSINELLRRKALIKLKYQLHWADSDPMVLLFNYRQERIVKNHAANQLGQLLNAKGYYADAISVLVSARPPFEAKFGVTNYSLLSQAYIKTGNYNRAIKLIESAPRLFASDLYLQYNLGIAKLKSGMNEEGLELLEDIGEHTIFFETEEELAIRDRANLTLANYFIEGERNDLAINYFKNIRLEGPYSNSALLGLGWAHIAVDNYKEAVATWKTLSTKNTNDYFAREALYSLPYGYSNLGLYNLSARLYDGALVGYFNYIDELDEAIAYVKSDSYLNYLHSKRWDKKYISGNSEDKSLHKKANDLLIRLGLFENLSFLNMVSSYLDVKALHSNLSAKQDRVASLHWVIDNKNKLFKSQIVAINKKYAEIRKNYTKILEYYYENNVTYEPDDEIIDKLSSEDRIFYEDILVLEERLKDYAGPEASQIVTIITKRIEFIKKYLFSKHLFVESIIEPDDSDYDELYSEIKILHANLVRFVKYYTQSIDSYVSYKKELSRMENELNSIEKRLSDQIKLNVDSLVNTSMRVLREERVRISNYISIVNNELKKSINNSRKQLLLAESQKILNERQQEKEDREKSIEERLKESQKTNLPIPEAKQEEGNSEENKTEVTAVELDNIAEERQTNNKPLDQPLDQLLEQNLENGE